MDPTHPHRPLRSTIDVHDQRRLELKLEYQPGADAQYFVETLFFIPNSLNVSSETWPRERFYADLQNYVRLKTPELSFIELCESDDSPLVQLERWRPTAGGAGEAELVWNAKMVGCVFRGALRRFSDEVRRRCAEGAAAVGILGDVEASSGRALEVVRRARAVCEAPPGPDVSKQTRTALQLVDEYVSLQAEQYLRRLVVHLDALPHEEALTQLRRRLMDAVLAEARYRRQRGLPSVVSHDADNEEYGIRVGFLKKFCQNILFLKAQRTSTRKAWEEVLLSLAAGGAMAFALGVGFYAQSRFPQASFNFFVIAVLGYMLKDRLKEGLRRFASAFAGRVLYERGTRIVDPVTQREVGVCYEKVEYGNAAAVPADVLRLRASDELVALAEAELSEMVVRYRKQVVLDSRQLQRVASGTSSGVTDIIRLSVDPLLYDMDDPEFELEYVDLDDLSVETLRLAKTYRVDVAFRCSVEDAGHRSTTVRIVRLLLDRNGIKRMSDLVPETVVVEPGFDAPPTLIRA